MSWNYRIIYHPPSKYKVGEEELDREEYLAIHEAYYDKKGIADGITIDAILAGGEGEDALISIKWTLEKMMEALNKPILDYETLKPIEKEKQNDFSKSIKSKK